MSNVFRSRPDFKWAVKRPDFLKGKGCGRQVCSREAQMVQCCENLVERKLQYLSDSAGKGGIDDRHAPGSQVVVARNRRRIDGGEAVVWKLSGELVRCLRRVDQYPATGL